MALTKHVTCYVRGSREQRSLCSLCRASPSVHFVHLFPDASFAVMQHCVLLLPLVEWVCCLCAVCAVGWQPFGLLAAEGCGPGSAEGGTHHRWVQQKPEWVLSRSAARRLGGPTHEHSEFPTSRCTASLQRGWSTATSPPSKRSAGERSTATGFPTVVNRSVCSCSHEGGSYGWVLRERLRWVVGWLGTLCGCVV